MNRLTDRCFLKMELEFCTEIDCLARDFCPGLKKHNKLFAYEETGVTPENLRFAVDRLLVYYHATKGLVKGVCGEILDLLGVDKGE